MTITRTLAIALGIAAMAAPTAQARPVEDIHTPLIQAGAQSQPDLQPDHAGWYPHAPGHPSQSGQRPLNAPGATAVDSATRPGPAPATSKPIAPSEPADGGSGVDWLTIGIGIAGSLLAVSGLAALNARRTRVPA
jgi:hypothetical protein